MDNSELARRARLMVEACDEKIVEHGASWTLLLARNRYERMAQTLEREAGREETRRGRTGEDRRRQAKENLLRGRKADRARREIGRDVYEGGEHYWEYYEWGCGNKPCWFRTDDDTQWYGQVGQRYSLTCAEECADPRERDPQTALQ